MDHDLGVVVFGEIIGRKAVRNSYFINLFHSNGNLPANFRGAGMARKRQAVVSIFQKLPVSVYPHQVCSPQSLLVVGIKSCVSLVYGVKVSKECPKIIFWGHIVGVKAHN